MNARSRNWCFTSSIKPEPNTERIQYMVYQKEIGEKTKREHYQGYVELNDKLSLKQLKLIFNDNTIHVEPRRGTQEQAINYCKKNDTRIEDPVEYGEPKKAGRRTDIDEILSDVNDGCTMEEILNTHGGNALRIINCVEKAMKVRHKLYALDDYIRLQRKENKDPLDEKLDDDLYKKLYN